MSDGSFRKNKPKSFEAFVREGQSESLAKSA
jgi:hypothetical protein